MTPFAVQSGSILPRHLSDFKVMSRLLKELPDNVIAGQLSCHHVCHALAQIFAYEAVDGEFGVGCDHSWLVLRHTRDGKVVADMYPVAGATPLLVYTHWMTPWSKMYVPQEDVLTRVRGKEDFDHNVATVRNAFHELNV